MTPGQFEHFRKLLESRQGDLLASKDAAVDSTRPVALDQASVGRLSRSDAMQGQAMAIESQRRRDLELRRIQSALSRIENQDYGLCVECDDEIAPGRLEIDPSADLCIGCASRREHRK